MQPRVLIATVLLALATAACSSTTEVWQEERLVEEVPQGPARCDAVTAGGSLRVTLSQPVLETVRPVARLVLIHEELESTINWEDVGMVIFYVFCGVAIVAGYILVYAGIAALEDSEPGSEP